MANERRSPQSHYFARLFSRWRSEAINVMNRHAENEQGTDKILGGSSSTPSSSFSLHGSDQTPKSAKWTKWKMDSKPKSKLSLEQPVVLLTETSSSGQGEATSSSPPASPVAANPLWSPDRRTSQPFCDENVTISYQNQQQQRRVVGVSVVGSRWDGTYNIGRFQSGHVDASCLDSSTPSTSSAIADATRPSTSGALHGLMEVRLPMFPLRKLRQKQQSFSDQAIWKPTDNCSWRSASGRCLRLRGAHLVRLAAVERQALQKYALTHLQKASLGCAILRPKDSLPVRQKRHKYIKRKAHTVNVVDKKDGSSLGILSVATIGNRKSPSPQGVGQHVFGVPLSQCIEHEQQLECAHHESTVGTVPESLSPPSTTASSSGLPQTQTQVQSGRQRPARPVARTHQYPLPSTSSSSSGVGTSVSGGQQPANRHLQQLIDEQKHRCQSLDLDEVEFLNVARASPQRLSAESSKSSLSDQASSDSLVMRAAYCKGSLSNQTSADNTPSSGRRYASSDSLLGSPSYQYSPRYTSSTYSIPKQDSCEPHLPRVPKVVQVCTEYLSQRGLQTIGIFRVAGSAKRCRQLRLLLDSGQEVVLNEEQPDIYPHDIATLLKEYFRDLPDPLLTKELYAPFIATAKFPEETRVELLRYLVSLLPLVNCDTLLVLLQFLRRVAKHSYDTINDQGVSMSGNKMNAHNLATVFGPTILRQAPGKSTQSWTENDAVIKVMETMIERCDDLFHIPASLQDTIYRSLCESDLDAVDLILTRLANEAERQTSEQEEELQTAVYFSSQEELDPPSLSKDSDGATVVRTRQTTTHRIVYKIHRPTGRILGSSRADEPSSAPSSSTPLADDKFPELTLFSDDEGRPGPASTSYADDPAELIELSSPTPAAALVGSPSTSRALVFNSLSKPPGRKLTPLVKFSEAMRPNSPKK